MQIALIGWQGGGKSSLFTALTGSVPPAGEEAVPGTARVPDPVLDRLHELYPPAKKVPARVDYLDVAGLAEASKRSGLKRSLLNHLQGATVLAPVIGLFHLGEDLDELAREARSQVEDLETELLLSDLAVVEGRLERIAHSKQRGQKVDAAEEAGIRRAHAALEEEIPLRRVEFTADEERALKAYGLMTAKPLLVVVNHGEHQAGGALAERLAGLGEGVDRRVEVLNVQLEAEIASLDEEDRGAFLEEMGIESPASERAIRACFDLLGLVRFFTVGDDEVRAWPVGEGTPAVQAAGVIHSDLEKGFIRAEVVSAEHLLEKGSLAACREAGLLRLEGKQYRVQDGDVMHVRFNV